MSIEFNNSLTEQTHTSCKKNINRLKSLIGILESIEKDSFLYYLMGIVYNKLESAEKGKQALIESVELNPFNWSAWLELASAIEKPTQLEEISEQLTESIASQCFKIQVLNDLQQSPELLIPIFDDLTNTIPNSKFTKIQKAILYHNSRGSICFYNRFRGIRAFI
jgi:anaphase-promoting complex subunit 8